MKYTDATIFTGKKKNVCPYFPLWRRCVGGIDLQLSGLFFFLLRMLEIKAL